MKVEHHKKIAKKRKESLSSSDQSDDKQIKDKGRPQLKKKMHSNKHRHNKRRHRSSSSDSSPSVDSASSSSDSTDSSSSSEDRKKKRKKNPNSSEPRKLSENLPESLNKSNDKEDSDDEPTNDIPLELMGAGRSMAPMTKEEWDKKQSVVKRVYDESTGRNRLIKGDGEVIEEMVSKERHKQINQQATKGDGEFFQKHLKQV